MRSETRKSKNIGVLVGNAEMWGVRSFLDGIWQETSPGVTWSVFPTMYDSTLPVAEAREAAAENYGCGQIFGYAAFCELDAAIIAASLMGADRGEEFLPRLLRLLADIPRLVIGALPEDGNLASWGAQVARAAMAAAGGEAVALPGYMQGFVLPAGAYEVPQELPPFSPLPPALADCYRREASDDLAASHRLTLHISRHLLQQRLTEDTLLRFALGELRRQGIGGAYMLLLEEPYRLSADDDLVDWSRLVMAGSLTGGEVKVVPRKERRPASLDEVFASGADDGLVHFNLFAHNEQYGLLVVAGKWRAFLSTLLTLSVHLGTALFAICRATEYRQMVAFLRGQSNRYERQAASDSLTGLYNRYGFFRQVQDFIASHEGERAVVAFADMDHLKEVNDLFGHHEGDLAILDVARMLRRNFGNEAIIGRIGGDEFVIFAFMQPGLTRKEWLARLKDITNEYNRESDKPYYVDISIGATEFTCEPGTVLSPILQESDTRLYRAKMMRRRSCIRSSV